jgi:hypothetical protein
MNILHVVHCIDTEGPLTESLEATFERIKAAFGVELPASLENLRKLQQEKISLGGVEKALARMISPNLLSYNKSWEEIRVMLLDMLSQGYRRRQLDDFGNGWVYSWHCMDHMHYSDNPRNKELGYGNVFRFYRNILAETESNDEVNWHFHPVSITKNPLHAATSYVNSYPILIEILCRRILEDNWFPSVNRPGFHAERPDSHAFLEQWIPFDYANQVHEDDVDQPDLSGGRFGDWRRAPVSWRGYHPAHEDYQQIGSCKRTIFRCLNVGTRFRSLKAKHVEQAFQEAQSSGSAILAFADHDYRDIRPDVDLVRTFLNSIRHKYPNVKLKFSSAEAAARALQCSLYSPKPFLSMQLINNLLEVRLLSGNLFGSQPFLAILDRIGRVHHDNFEIQAPGKCWTYTFDDQTLPLSAVEKIGVGSAGLYGHYFCKVIKVVN